MIEKQYLPFLEKVLTPKRLDHSLSVMRVMGELADVYRLDLEKALTIGILHDAAKDLPRDQQKQLIREGNIKVEHECENDYVFYMHGPVGSYLVHKELDITDDLILDAITTHTYIGNSRYFNDPHSWCMRFADILEPTRNWSNEPLLLEGAACLKELVFDGKLIEGAYFQTAMIIEWFGEKKVPIHPNMLQVKDELEVAIAAIKSSNGL